MLYKAYTSSGSYLKDEGAYYIDSPFLSIDKLVDVMCNSVPLDSFSFQELIDLSETLIHFLGYESIDYQMKITDFLVQLFLIFIKENNCEVDSELKCYSRKFIHVTLKDVFTEERNKLFLQHSYLFDYFNVIDVTLQYSFDDRIPYEYIYPSNLHELFPKIKRYVIDTCYYPLKKYIQIKSTDIHYTLLYKEYKRQYYEKYYPEAYYIYENEHPEIEANKIEEGQVYIYPMNNHGDNESIEKDKEEIHHEIIDIDIDEEIRNEKEEEKPDLYIESLSDYSREYNEEMIKKEKKDSPIDDEIIHSFCYFIFVDDNEIIDRQHPILYETDVESNDILLYILNLPICKQLKKIEITDNESQFLLQLKIPPLLLLLKDSLYSSLEIFNISQFINTRMYPEYIQLFKEIIKTHVFPNVTTLYIDSDVIQDYDINVIQDIVSLITRDRFPKLHIYSLLPFNEHFYDENDSILSKMHILVPTSLLDLIDTIQLLTNDYLEEFPNNKNIYNNLIVSKKQHNINIKANINIHTFISTWKQLYDNGLLTIGNIIYDFSEIDYNPSDYSLIDLSVYPFKSLTIRINSFSYEELESVEKIYMNMNYQDLQKLTIDFWDRYQEEEYDVVEFINKYFSFLCKGNYNTVTSLAIIFHMNIEEELEESDDSEIYDMNKFNDYENIEKKLEQLYESDIHTLNDIIYPFFSLFSDNIKEFKIDGHLVRNSIFLTEKYISLPFWSNIQHLSLDLIGNGKKKILNSLTHFFKNKKLRNLISLKFDYGHHFELSSFLEFIEGFTLNSSFSLPFPDTFKEPISYNVFNFFPSFLYFLHKPITYIRMKDSIIEYEENKNENDLYDQYIYNQLQQNYCKNIIDLNLCIDESSVISNIIDLIINNHFCYLRNLSVLFNDNDTYTKYSSLINNYKEKYNPNLNITYHNRQIDDYD
ncbi:hypothetical protein WA158_002550 [Blastocystis sp. Blastoise]